MTDKSFGDMGNLRAFSREQLHEWIWQDTKTATARSLGIRQVELSKACVFHSIPIPCSGFWTKVQMGRPTEVIPLPPTMAVGAVEFIGDLFVETYRERAARKRQRSGLADDIIRKRAVQLEVGVSPIRASAEEVIRKRAFRLEIGVPLIRSSACGGLTREDEVLASGFSEHEMKQAMDMASRRFRPRAHGKAHNKKAPRYSAPALTLEGGLGLEAFNHSAAEVRHAVSEYERNGLSGLAEQLRRCGAFSRRRVMVALASPLAGFKEQRSAPEDDA